MIEVAQLTKKFGEICALDALSFTVQDGVAFGLLGRNGAGKTTCIRIIMDIFQADGGRVSINGAPAHGSKARIGYLPEERGLYQKRAILEQMVYIGRLRGLSAQDAPRKAKERLEELEASEYLDRKLDTLSKGNQQKIQLAIALINDPDVIILDEPFSGLDPVNAGLLKEIVRKQVRLGKTVIFSSHQMSQVEEFCDDICLIDKGRSVLEGNLERIKKSYPRNIVYFEVTAQDAAAARRADGWMADLRAGLGTAIRDISERKSGYLVTLASSDDKAALFRTLSELDIVPEAFAVQEPTLEDIFIETVGGAPEQDGDTEDESAPEKKRRKGGGLFRRGRRETQSKTDPAKAISPKTDGGSERRFRS
ncbi:MAG: ATP-binding cassette domain-containing protein [Clostridiales Family XIII bacterium]|jgi:ABC-2 type transport system ATP-binding protein|nr:ATP-binding cassette domain-containing protein [Clostridiales Family XIII bacterium]